MFEIDVLAAFFIHLLYIRYAAPFEGRPEL